MNPTTDFPDLPYWPALLGTMLSALAAALLVVLTKRHHGHFTMDSMFGVQKFHHEPTPRVGGVAIFAGTVAALVLAPSGQVRELLAMVLLAGLPALAAGFLEDLTKRVGVRTRLLATMASGGLAWAVTGIAVDAVGWPWVDALLAWTPLAVAFTAFALAGVANSINIIDGFHGLASGTAAIALLALASIAAMVGDTPLALTACLLAAAVAGFWLVNYPWGKLFLGDGGAYFTGFAVGWLAVLLPARNPGVSIWAPLLVCAYPVIEVLYSVVRRWRSRQSPGAPDRRHLHSLVKTRLVDRILPRAGGAVQNAAVAPFLWGFAALPALWGVAFHAQEDWLVAGVLGCVLLYHLAYVAVATEGRRGVEPPPLFLDDTRQEAAIAGARGADE